MRSRDFLGEKAVALTERIIGGLAIGYHRTRNLKNVNAIGESGFKAGSGDMYGPGIYLTYDFSDQQDDYMREHYGPYIIRCKAVLHGYLIFDEEVAAAVYGRRSSLDDQFRMFGLDNDLLKHIKGLLRGQVYTSIAARNFAATVHGKKQQGKVKGIVFTGENDGRVIVAYDPATVKSLGYARVIDDAKPLDKVKWRRFETATAGQALPAATVSPVGQFYRAIKRFGFRLAAHGDAGARLVGKVNGRYVTVNMVNKSWSDARTVSAYMTQSEPEALEKRLPGSVERVGIRLFWQNYSNGQPIPYSEIVRLIVDKTGSYEERLTHDAKLWEDAVRLLVKPGVAVETSRGSGKEYSQEWLHVAADGLALSVKSLADPSMTGLLVIPAKPDLVETVTVRPIHFEGEVTAEIVYARVLACMQMGFEMSNRKRLGTPELPSFLSERFHNDLLRLLGAKGAES